MIIGAVLVVGFWLWHEFVVRPARLVDQLCERASVIEMDKTSEDARTVPDEMTTICRERKPIEE